MPYVIDRQRALFANDVVAVMAARTRRVKSRVILRDNSLYHTLTRPRTLAERLQEFPEAILRAGGRHRATGPPRERGR